MNPAPYPIVPCAVIAAVALLPFGRMVEIPMGVLSLLGFLLLLHSPRRSSAIFRTLGLAYLAFVLPMLLALPDAVEGGKSLRTTVGSLRFLLSSFALLALLTMARDPDREQKRALDLIGLGAALFTTLWCADGLWQFLSGTNVLGYGRGDGYVNGIFGEDDHIKFGITVALLMPLCVLQLLRRAGPTPATALLLLLLALVVLSGKRGAWITAAVELAVIATYYLLRGQLRWRRAGLLAVGSAVVFVTAFAASDWVRQRSTVVIDAIGQPDYETVNRATGKRLPIWSTALRMGQDNWLNGVGARGFRYAYADYAGEEDPWAEPLGSGRGARASHAHQLLLDLWCETGLPGLVGYVAMVAVLVLAWRRATPGGRSRALPFAAALVGMLFPVNTHSAFYSSWSSLLMWMFIAMYLYALHDARESAARTDAVAWRNRARRSLPATEKRPEGMPS